MFDLETLVLLMFTTIFACGAWIFLVISAKLISDILRDRREMWFTVTALPCTLALATLCTIGALSIVNVLMEGF